MSRNRASTDCECGWPLDRATHVEPPRSEASYLTLVGQTRYLNNSGYGWVHDSRLYGPVQFQRIECPICGRIYAGWLAAREHGPTADFLFDSSFWHSFNDEPAYNPHGPSADAPLTDYRLEDILQAWTAAGRPGICPTPTSQSPSVNSTPGGAPDTGTGQ